MNDAGRPRPTVDQSGAAASVPAQVKHVCLLGPSMYLASATPAFAAAHPELEVTHIDYVEPRDLRRARAMQAVTPALAAQAPPLDDLARAALSRAEAVIALDLPSPIAELAPNLRLVQAFGAGIEWLVPAGLDDRGVALTNASGVAADSIAEFVIARILEVSKDLRRLAEQQQAHVWRQRWATELMGRTMAVVSLGAIGRATARRARAFGMEVIGTRRSARVGDTDPDADELRPLSDLDAVLARADVVVLAAPATAETADLFDARRFAAMRPGSTFVNVSRGSMVDEAALLAALTSGHLGAAVIDVVKDEPAPPDHPFWDAPRMYLSPHCSASFDRYTDRLFALFEDNLRRLADGRPLRNVVDPALGY
jgi:phosphoglycerate dehydrogenase-like enzyme